MKRYKLVKEYPGSPHEGYVIEPREGTNMYFYNDTQVVGVTSSPEYWEEVKEEFKVGDWYTIKTPVYYGFREDILPISRVDEVGIYCKDNDGSESYLSESRFLEQYRKATEEEVLQYLIGKSGLKVGDRLQGKQTNVYDYKREEHYDIFGDDFIRHIESFEVLDGHLIVNFPGDNGEHGFRAEDFKKITDTFKIGEYDVKKVGDTVKVGCQSYSKEDISAARLLLKRDAYISIKGIEVTSEVLDKMERLIGGKTEGIARVGIKFIASGYLVYTIYKIDGSRVWVNWESDTHGVSYERHRVEELFKEGTWKLV